VEEQLLRLQRAAGNEAVAGLISESSVLQRAPVAAPARGKVTQPDELFLLAVRQEAEGRLEVLTHAIVAGANSFRNDADKMVDTYIKEVPKQISGFGPVCEALIAAGEVIFPEAGLAHDIYLTAKTVKEMMKPGLDVIDKANEAVYPRSVEEAKIHLKQIAMDAAEEVENRAPRALKGGLETVRDSVRAYLHSQPQPLQHNEAFYRAMCDAIGVKDVDPDDARMKVWRQVMPAFQKELMRTKAGLHFFHELDSDGERLLFLIEQVEKGNDPDALLDHIGADREYWDRYLAIYRARGKEAAIAAILKI
jgi:hypothetical protein